MNRYEFEDKISDYIENQLSVSERMAFEEYINENKEGRDLLHSIAKTINVINAQKSIKTSERFMPNLIEKVNSYKKTTLNQNNLRNKKLFFGLTPMNSVLMSAFIFSFVFLLVNIIPTENTFFQSNIASNKKSMIEKTDPKSPSGLNEKIELVSADSSDSLKEPKEKIKFDFQSVKNKR